MKLKTTLYFSMLTLALTACASANARVPTVMPTSVPVNVFTANPPSVPTSVPMAAPSEVPAILPTPASIIPIDERLLATINTKEHPLVTPGMFGNHPDEIVFAQGFIWTKTDNGHVIQVDPATNKMVGAIKVDTTTAPDHYCQGLGTDGENIWACSASGDNSEEKDNRIIDVVRIDPQTQSIVETVKVDKVHEQFDMPFLANQIWVLSGNGDKLIGIDVTTNQPGPAIELGTRCFQLAATEKALFATCSMDNLVLQIDPKKKEVTRRANIQSPRYIAATKNAIWVLQDSAVLRLDPVSLSPVVTFTNLPQVGWTGDIFPTDEAVWIRQESSLYRIQPTRNEITEQIKPNESLTAGSVLVTSDSIWITATENDLLLRLSLSD